MRKWSAKKKKGGKKSDASSKSGSSPKKGRNWGFTDKLDKSKIDAFTVIKDGDSKHIDNTKRDEEFKDKYLGADDEIQ